jgi:hypothetical protein
MKNKKYTTTSVIQEIETLDMKLGNFSKLHQKKKNVLVHEE